MLDSSSQSFKYTGQKYTLAFTLYTNTDRYYQLHTLNNEDVLTFEYENTANKLYLEGSILYVDRRGLVDKYLEKQFSYCRIMFAEIDSENHENIAIEKLNETATLSHEFFITSIEIVERQDNIITYNIHLVSVNWFNLQANLAFSNYGKKPETILDLVKTMLSLSELNVDNNTFDQVKTDVKINYITNGNDTAETAIKYLLAHLYYYDTKDSALKFLYYNDIKNKYSIFDFMNSETSNGVYSLMLSFFKTQGETYLQEEPINIGSVTKITKTSTFKNIYDYNVIDYDYQHNTFIDKSIKSADIIDYQNKKFPNTSYDEKFEKIFNTKFHFKHRSTYWNDNNLIKIYNNALDTLMKDNSIVLNTSGMINRKPGDFVNINVDRELTYVEGENYESLDVIKKKYKAYEGQWFVGKIHHFVFPQIGKYRQNLVLFRNYVTRDIDQESQ